METKNTLHRLFLIAIVVAFTASMAWSQGGTTLPKFNIFNDANLVLETEKLNDFDYKFKIVPKDRPEDSRTFVVMPLTQETFVNSFTKEISAIPRLAESLSDSAQKAISRKDLIRVEAQRIFIFVQASGITSESISDEPLAGTLCLRKDIEIRQYIRINSAKVQKYSNKFLIIKLCPGEAIKNGKVESGYDWEPKAKGESGYTRQLTPRDEDLRDDIHGFSSTVAGYVLTSKGRGDSTNNNIFEFYKHSVEARNRLDYLAHKMLSDTLSQQRKNLILTFEAKKAEMNREKEIIDSLRHAIEEYDSTLKEITTRSSSVDSVARILNSLENEFNRLGQDINYSITNGKVLIESKSYKYGSIKSPSKDSISLSEAVEASRGLAFRLKQSNLDVEEYLKVLEKILQNKGNGKSSTSGLDRHEIEVLIEFQVLDEKRTYVQMKADITKEFDKIGFLEFRRTLSTEKSDLEEDKRKLRTVELLEQILQEYIITDRNKKGIAMKINLLPSRTLVNKRITEYRDSISKGEKIVDKLLITTDSIEKSIAKLEEQNPLPTFIIEYATIEFNQGFIENIVVYGSIEGRPEERIKFTNVMPIGFSRKKDFDDLANYDLWTEPTSNNNRSRYSMNLGDFFENYLQNLGLNRRDYSPADGAVKIDLEKGTCVELKKAPTYRLLEGKVFSDFVGLDEKSPNGLIQTEIGQKINLRTSRLGRYFLQRGGIRGESKRLMYRSRSYVNRGYLGYIHPLLTLSKIENKNRSLLLDSRDRIVNNEYLQDRYISSMQLRNHEYLSAGLDLNIYTFDRPTLKSTLYFDLGFRFGRTQVIDSVRSVIDSIPQNNGKGSEFGVNTFRFYPKLILEIKPEERYGLNMSYAWNQYYLLHPTITQVAVPERYKAIGQNRLPSSYGTFELQAFFNPSVDNPTGKLFFRYSFNHQGLNLSTNFHQAQVGYSFFLLGRNKVRTQPD